MNLLGQEQHHTVVPSDVEPQLREVQNVYHCPLCARKGAYHAMVPHLQTHKLYSLNHAGFTIYRCNGGCVTRTHFHCCFCKRIYDRKACFLKHLPACELGKGSSIGGPSVPPPVTGPYVPPVKGPSVPPVTGPSIPPPVTGPSIPPPVTDPSVPPVKGPSVPPVTGPSIPPPVTGPSVPPPVTGPSIPPPVTGPSILPPVTGASVPPVTGPSIPPPVTGPSIPPPVTGPSVPPVTDPSVPPSVTGPTMLGQLLAVNEHKVLPLVWISDSKSIFAVTRTEPGLTIYPILFQNNSRRDIIETHHTVVPPDVEPQLREVQNVYHCPLCARKGDYAAMVPHLQSHTRYTIKHAGFTIHKCNDGCVRSSHFHCCFCNKVFVKRVNFLQHLRACELEKGTSISGPSKPPSNTGPSVPPTETGPSVCLRKTGPFNKNRLWEKKRKRKTGPSLCPTETGPSVSPSNTGPSKSPSNTSPHVRPSKSGPSVSPSKSGPSVSPAPKKREWRVKRTLCGFCHLKLNVKNLKVHIKRRHPDKDVRDVVPPKKVCTAKVKKTTCRFCHMELHEKNLKLHIERRHSTKIVDLSEDDFLSFGCIDTKKGSFDTGPSYPSHEQYSGEDLMQDIIASVISHELTLD